MDLINAIKKKLIRELLDKKIKKQQELINIENYYKDLLQRNEERTKKIEDAKIKRKNLEKELKFKPKDYNILMNLYDYLNELNADYNFVFNNEFTINELNEKISTVTQEMKELKESGIVLKKQLIEKCEEFAKNRVVISEIVPFKTVDLESSEQYLKYIKEYDERNNIKREYELLIAFIKRFLPKEFTKQDLKVMIDKDRTIRQQIEELNQIIPSNKKNETREREKGIEEEKNAKKKIDNLKKQIEEINHKVRKIEEENSLTNLGFSTAEEAKMTLNINTVDYLVIPLYRENLKGYNVFNSKRKLDLRTEEIHYQSEYDTETVKAAVNTDSHFTGDEEAALLIPLKEIKPENIIRINDDGTIQLKKFDLPKNAIIITNENSIETYVDTLCIGNNLYDGIQQILEKSYTTNLDITRYYKVVQDSKMQVSPDDIEKDDLVYEILNENYRTFESLSERKVYVDDKIFLPKQDKFLKKQSEKISVQTLKDISSQLSELMKDGQGNIDQIYGRLLTEYLRINPKAKPKYNEENFNKLTIRGYTQTIKPKLPQSDNKIMKRAFRPEEDYSYKLMKVAVLCNKFAHRIADELSRTSFEDLQNMDNVLFDIKAEIIKQVINMSNENEKISIGKVYDSKGSGIIMDIPYYSTVVLHISNRDIKLQDMLEELPDYTFMNYKAGKNLNYEMNPTIMIDGVNIDTIKKMKEIKSVGERIALVKSMNIETLHKLLIRFGYTSKDFLNNEKRIAIIKKICSDEGLNELIQDMQERGER